MIRKEFNSPVPKESDRPQDIHDGNLPTDLPSPMSKKIKTTKELLELQSYPSYYLPKPAAPNQEGSLTLKLATLKPVLSIIKQAKIPALWPEGGVPTKAVIHYLLILEQDYC